MIGLSRRILKHSKKTKIKLNIHKNPSFITSEDTLKSFFKSEKKILSNLILQEAKN